MLEAWLNKIVRQAVRAELNERRFVEHVRENHLTPAPVRDVASKPSPQPFTDSFESERDAAIQNCEVQQ